MQKCVYIFVLRINFHKKTKETRVNYSDKRLSDSKNENIVEFIYEFQYKV